MNKTEQIELLEKKKHAATCHIGRLDPTKDVYQITGINTELVKINKRLNELRPEQSSTTADQLN